MEDLDSLSSAACLAATRRLQLPRVECLPQLEVAARVATSTKAVPSSSEWSYDSDDGLSIRVDDLCPPLPTRSEFSCELQLCDDDACCSDLCCSLSDDSMDQEVEDEADRGLAEDATIEDDGQPEKQLHEEEVSSVGQAPSPCTMGSTSTEEQGSALHACEQCQGFELIDFEKEARVIVM